MLQGLVVLYPHAEDSLTVVYTPAVSAAWSVKLPVHGWASIRFFEQHTHASDPIPYCLPQIFRGFPETDSLI